MKKFIKIVASMVLVIMTMVSLTACSSKNEETTTTEDNTKVVERLDKIEAKVKEVTEVDKVKAVVENDTAYVSVKLKDTKVDTISPELKTALEEKIKEADPEIKTINLSIKEETYGLVEQLYDDIKSGKTMETIRTNFDKMVEKMKQ